MYDIIHLPWEIPISKDKTFKLNLNSYRNAHYQTLNKVKIAFKETIKEALETVPKYKWVYLRYYIYPGSKRKMDISNVCSVVDKFFSDAFVETGHLPDDNYKCVRGVSYQFGEVDKDFPRITVYIQGELED